MFRKENLLPVLALAAGAGAACLRARQLKTGFEADTGLPVPGDPASIAMAAVCAAAAVIVLLLVRLWSGPERPKEFGPAFQAGGSFLALFIGVIAGAAFFCAGAAQCMAVAARTVSGLAGPVFALFAFAAGLAMVAVSVSLYQQQGEAKGGLALLVPAFFACFWLIDAYRQEAADPVRASYIYYFFALIAAMAGFYYCAGYAFRNVHPRRTVYFSCMAVFFCTAALPDTLTPAIHLLLVGCVLWFLVQSEVLLCNLRAPIAPSAPRPRRDAGDEDVDDDVDIVL